MSEIYLLLFVVVFCGALVQGSTGIGYGLVAAPLFAILDPALVPASLLLTATPLVLIMLVKERRHVRVSEVRWLLVGRLFGAILGGLLVGFLPIRGLQLVVGLTVSAAALASLAKPRWAQSSHTTPSAQQQGLAGVVSGVTGTAVGIGGPPIALLYQRLEGAEFRGLLAMTFGIGQFISLLSLGAFGHVHVDDFRNMVVLLPAIVLGLVVSGLVLRYLNNDTIKKSVLIACCASGVVAIAQALF